MEETQNKRVETGGAASAETDEASGAASRGMACMKRLEEATNQHDIEALTQCFDPAYESEFPAHLDRAFRGHEPMRRNWTQIFASAPDIHSTLVRAVVDGETVWTEWDWAGTRVDGEPFHMRGVTIQTIPEDRIAHAWLYMEPVQGVGPGLEAGLRRPTLTPRPKNKPGEDADVASPGERHSK
ncbi:MAG: nuclear transport factor 2 family protein [Chloroflexi bacterium]|nr:nuclear transport factor 2 family protein [Chloroflexota bacterium]